MMLCWVKTGSSWRFCPWLVFLLQGMGQSLQRLYCKPTDGVTQGNLRQWWLTSPRQVPEVDLASREAKSLLRRQHILTLHPQSQQRVQKSVSTRPDKTLTPVFPPCMAGSTLTWSPRCPFLENQAQRVERVGWSTLHRQPLSRDPECVSL